MRHYLEYEFRDFCLRFLLGDNDLLTLIAINSGLPLPRLEIDCGEQAELPQLRDLPFPVDSPALNIWLYLNATGAAASESSWLEFPRLPQVKSLLCQQLRTQLGTLPPAAEDVAGVQQTPATDNDRVMIEIHLDERPCLVVLTAEKLADQPLDDAVAFYVSVNLALQQVAADCGKLQHRARAAAAGVASEWLLDLQGKKHLFGLDSAKEDIIRRAEAMVANQDATANHREELAVRCAKTAVRDRGQAGGELLISGELLPGILGRLVRLDELENRFADALQQEKIASLKQLAYGASHEINNPLGNIATRSQTLLRGEADPERRRQLAMIVSQAYRAHDMISDMMLFAHPPTLRLETASLYDAACRAIGDLQASADQQGTIVQLQSETEVAELYADADHLVMLVKALCQNALEACQAGGQVKVTIGNCIAVGKTFFRLDVADDGPGLSETARRHLFDPFYSGREAGRGLGLGLSKAWTIARLHAGRIEISEGEEGGTKFSVFLPAAAAVPLHA